MLLSRCDAAVEVSGCCQGVEAAIEIVETAVKVSRPPSRF
jgi:4-hydroxy-3-methylbut-2-enyl diphosphate reductase IspH